MKLRSLTYNIERSHMPSLLNSSDFASFLDIGRMLNVLGVAAESCKAVYLERDTGYRCEQAATFMSRLISDAGYLVSSLWIHYDEEPFFEHFKEMFSGQVRDFTGITVNKICPAEFRLVSRDSYVNKELKHFDMFGLDIIFPVGQKRAAYALEAELATRIQFAQYTAIRPKDKLELQHLLRQFTFIHDFGIGAEIFLKALAKKLGIKQARVKDDATCPAVKPKMPKWYEKN